MRIDTDLTDKVFMAQLIETIMNAPSCASGARRRAIALANAIKTAADAGVQKAYENLRRIADEAEAGEFAINRAATGEPIEPPSAADTDELLRLMADIKRLMIEKNAVIPFCSVAKEVSFAPGQAVGAAVKMSQRTGEQYEAVSCANCLCFHLQPVQLDKPIATSAALEFFANPDGKYW